MSQKISNVFRKNNRADNLDDILVDIYDLILSKVNSKDIPNLVKINKISGG